MKHKTQSEMEPMVAAYAQYSGTKKSFCAEQGINPHTFYYWQRKLSEHISPPKKGNKFIALEVKGSRREDVGKLGQLELVYPNGNRILLPISSSLQLIEQLVQLNC